MQRNLSGWGVTASGLLLVCGGVYAMSTGWDMILVERGWSLFISGAVALSGGVITIALGRVIAHLSRLAAPATPRPAAPATVPMPEASRPAPPPTAPAPQPVEPEPAPAASAARPDFAAILNGSVNAAPAAAKTASAPARITPTSGKTTSVQAKAASATAMPPTEVDRYTAGDATYIMMSDGSVEVHGPDGMQRYPSLAALRGDAESRRR